MTADSGYKPPVFTFKLSDKVVLRGTIYPPMFVIGNASCDDWGFGGSYVRLFWLDDARRPHTVVLPEAILEKDPKGGQ